MNREQILADLKDSSLETRQKALQYCLKNLKSLERIELGQEFTIQVDGLKDVIGNICNAEIVLEGWTDAMISLFFLSCSEYMWGVICDARSKIDLDAPDEEELESSHIYELIEDTELKDYDNLLDGHISSGGKWAAEAISLLWFSFDSEHYLAPYEDLDFPLVKNYQQLITIRDCLIEDSSCLRAIPDQFMMSFIRCTFGDLDCSYLKPTHPRIADDNDFLFYWENCKLRSVQNLQGLEAAIAIGFDRCEIEKPIFIPENGDKRNYNRNQCFSFISDLTIDPSSTRIFFDTLSLGHYSGDLTWLAGRSIEELVCDWDTFCRLIEQNKDNLPEIETLFIVGSDPVDSPVPPLLVDLPKGCSQLGVKNFMSNADLGAVAVIEENSEHYEENLLLLLRMLEHFPLLRYAHFPEYREPLYNANRDPLNHGVWSNGESPEMEFGIELDTPMCTETEGAWKCLGYFADLSRVYDGICLDISATREALGLEILTESDKT